MRLALDALWLGVQRSVAAWPNAPEGEMSGRRTHGPEGEPLAKRSDAVNRSCRRPVDALGNRARGAPGTLVGQRGRETPRLAGCRPRLRDQKASTAARALPTGRDSSGFRNVLYLRANASRYVGVTNHARRVNGE